MAQFDLLRGRYAPGPKTTKTTYTAFGWNVDKQVMDIGAAIVTTAAADIERSRAPNITFYVRGRATASSTTETWADREPGMFSGDKTIHPGGIITIRAVEETEFWCFNRYFNGGKLPVVTVFRFPTAGTLTVPLNQKILVCRGQVETFLPGTSFEAATTALSCVDNTYGFLIEAARETN